MRGIRLIGLFFLMSFSVFAQQKQVLDSLIATANSSIFDRPERAIEIANQILENPNSSPTDQISAYIIISSAHSILGKYEKSNEFALKAYNLSNQTNDDASRLKTLGFVANQYMDMEMADEAWRYLSRTDELLKTVSLPDSMQYLIGNINLLKGWLYQKDLNCDYAVRYFNQAIGVFEKNKENVYANINLAQAYNQKGFCYLNIDIDSAKISLTRGLQEANRAQVSVLESNALLGIAEVLSLESNFNASNDSLQRALEIVKETDEPGMESQIYKIFTQNYLQLGDKENHLINKKLFTQQHRKSLDEDEVAINKILKSRIQKNLSQIQKEERKSGMIYWTGGILFLLISGFCGIKIWRESKKIKQIKAEHQN